MARLKREQSQALTCERLIESATELFRRDGYMATSVERIAEAAGYSKGAVYSNFDSKEAIFLRVLDLQGQESLDRVIAGIDAASSDQEVVEVLIGWANDRSRSGIWSLTILEHARVVGGDAPSLARQREILRSHWRQLGEVVLHRFAGMTADPETIGALLHEIAYAPALTFMGHPKAGELMRLALAPWLGRPASG
jgi:AcrR family transcriptional regulator